VKNLEQAKSKKNIMQVHNKLKVHNSKLSKSIAKNYDLYLLILPVIAYFVIFKYWPMYGVQIAFKNYIATRGVWGSPWVGFSHFKRFFNSFYFSRLIFNTIGISLYSLVLGFPAPILLALMMNELRSDKFKKVVQTVTYAPHFLSTVVIVSMLIALLSPRSGIINQFLKLLGKEPIYFMAEPGWFKTLYVLSGIWQNTGWNSIIYMAALAGIDVEIYEAAMVDGATKFKRLIYITLPYIVPTAVTLLILNVGSIMNVGFEKVFLMQNDRNLPASDVIATYVYRSGLLGAEFSFSSAVGLFNSVINFILLIAVNKISKKLTETSLW